MTIETDAKSISSFSELEYDSEISMQSYREDVDFYSTDEGDSLVDFIGVRPKRALIPKANTEFTKDIEQIPVIETNARPGGRTVVVLGAGESKLIHVRENRDVYPIWTRDLNTGMKYHAREEEAWRNGWLKSLRSSLTSTFVGSVVVAFAAGVCIDYFLVAQVDGNPGTGIALQQPKALRA